MLEKLTNLFVLIIIIFISLFAIKYLYFDEPVTVTQVYNTTDTLYITNTLYLPVIIDTIFIPAQIDSTTSTDVIPQQIPVQVIASSSYTDQNIEITVKYYFNQKVFNIQYKIIQKIQTTIIQKQKHKIQPFIGIGGNQLLNINGIVGIKYRRLGLYFNTVLIYPNSSVMVGISYFF